jgi:hypothetical protein
MNFVTESHGLVGKRYTNVVLTRREQVSEMMLKMLSGIQLRKKAPLTNTNSFFVLWSRAIS